MHHGEVPHFSWEFMSSSQRFHRVPPSTLEFPNHPGRLGGLACRRRWYPHCPLDSLDQLLKYDQLIQSGFDLNLYILSYINYKSIVIYSESEIKLISLFQPLINQGIPCTCRSVRDIWPGNVCRCQSIGESSRLVVVSNGKP